MLIKNVSKMSPDIAKCLLQGKITHSLEPLNHGGAQVFREWKGVEGERYAKGEGPRLQRHLWEDGESGGAGDALWEAGRDRPCRLRKKKTSCLLPGKENRNIQGGWEPTWANDRIS